jgi:16S rRNA (cytidine1402-2'-O)-methyltransferase
MSPRAVRTLREAHLIAAEDTRHTRQLLTHFDVHTPLTSYFEHNKLAKLDKILSALAEGDVALVSDAGTPGINDPGFELVKAALDAGHTVSPLPGPSAPIAALAASGLPADSFLYLGYLPRNSAERRKLLQEVAALPYTLVFLETPHRLQAAFEDILTVLGDRSMTAARELTKLHEEFVRGQVSEVRAHFTQHEPRGEFVLVVAGQRESAQERWTDEQLQLAIASELNRGGKTKEISSRLAAESGWSKKEIYSFMNRDSEKEK